MTVNCFAQEGVIIKEDKLMMEYKGNLFEINDSIITVKYKENAKNLESLQIVRTNKLGYVDIICPPDIPITEFVEQLKKTMLFETIEYNIYGQYLSFTPNDTYLSNQWYLSSINAYSAWNLTKGSSDIIVAILDSGFEWTHVDLGLGADSYQNVYLNTSEDSWVNPNNPATGNNIDDDNNGFVDDWKGWDFDNNDNDVRTNFFHGTMVAGIVGAKTNNNCGVAGVTNQVPNYYYTALEKMLQIVQ